MIRTGTIFAILSWIMVASSMAQAQQEEDPYLWLEEVTSERALDWSRQQNAECVKVLAESDAFTALKERLQRILDSEDKIPYVDRIGGRYYNFWRDAEHPRGLWRRTTLESYRTKDPEWEVVIDLDALAEAEGENWVWHGAEVLEPDDRRALVALSRGGADADVKREFDLEAKQFIDGGFALPEAKSRVAWRDQDSVLVATDFGPGSLTKSGYPRIVKQWKRGTPLSEAETVFEGSAEDMVVAAYTDRTPGFEREFVVRRPSFWTMEMMLRRDGELIRIDIPDDARPSIHREWLFVWLRTDWKPADINYPADSLLAIHFDRFLEGDREFAVLFEPEPRKSLADFAQTRNYLLLNELDNVRNRIYVLTPPEDGRGPWQREPLPGVPPEVSASVSAVDPIDSDEYFLTLDGYVTPPTYLLGKVGEGPAEELKQGPAFFDASGLKVEQHHATSADGTRIPYFIVLREDLELNGSNPTLLYGYGGFEIPMLPAYSAVAGAAWIERGGVFVVANIRGGGEFGPKWHQAALKENRHKAYEDFIAVAEDLIDRRITRPERLGIMGGSNGGLLMGNMLVRRPDLFGAIVCQVPLLDMRRYHMLLAGASWMDEYGNPDDPEEWEFIKTFSPYHMVRADKDYPPILFTTSTRDDRVHPAHARKMVARMKEQGHNVLYYENIEGGHGGAANNEQRAFMSALAYTFLWKQLKGE